MLLHERKRLTSWFLYVMYEFKNKIYSLINFILLIQYMYAHCLQK